MVKARECRGKNKKSMRDEHEIRQCGCCMRQEVGDHLQSLWLDFPWVAGGRLQVDAFSLFFTPPFPSILLTIPNQSLLPR